MNKLLTFLVCFVLLSGCKNKSTEAKEPAGRIWMKELYSYLRVKNTVVPESYTVFEQKVLESPDRMAQLYDYLKADSADVPSLPRDFVDKLTDGFPLPDRNLICVWMFVRNLDNQFTLDYVSFKRDISNENFRRQFYNHIRDINSGFTLSYREFSDDMGVSNKKGVIF